MKSAQSTETLNTVTFQSDYSKKEIDQKFHLLISASKKVDPFYIFKDPSYLLRNINYAGVRIRENQVYMTRSVTTPPILIYLESTTGEKITLTFKISYLPVFRWAFYVSIPMTLYFMYQAIQADNSNKAILLTIAFSLIVWVFIGSLAFAHEKSIHYFFKRDVNMIINDLSNI